jgi:Zn-dependent protease/CBS domain-containing protein
LFVATTLPGLRAGPDGEGHWSLRPCAWGGRASRGNAEHGRSSRRSEAMKWSWKIARLAGIDIYIHATFLILVAWIGFGYWELEGSVDAVIRGIGFILALFACVVLHEMGHALMARRYGIATRHITLLPIGGIAALERMPDDPKQEMTVALAGPAVNVVIAVGLWLLLSASGVLASLDEVSFTQGPFLVRLMVVNVMLATFNMLPALPMDGGRVFRAVLAMRMEHRAATEKAAKVGQGLALVLGFLGLLYNPFLLFIAFFVWIGAAAELHGAQMKSTLSGIPVGKAMLTDFQTLLPKDPLSHAVELTLKGSQKDFPVLQAGTIVGVLTQGDLLKGLQTNGDRAQARDHMHRDVHTARIEDPLEDVLERLQGTSCRLLSVTSGGHLAGILNLDNFMEYLAIQAAIQDGTTR